MRDGTMIRKRYDQAAERTSKMPFGCLFGNNNKGTTSSALSKSSWRKRRIRTLRSSSMVCAASSLAMPAAVAETQTAPVDLTSDTSTVVDLLPQIPDLPVDSASLLNNPSGGEMLAFVLFCALVSFVLVAGWAVVREKRRAREHLLAANQALQTLQLRLDQSESLLNASDQLIVIWSGSNAAPQISGSLVSGDRFLPSGKAILAFGNWLDPDCALKVEAAVESLRTTGHRFHLTAETLQGGYVEIKGRTSGARALMQLRVLEGEDHDRARITHEASRQGNELARMKSLLDSIPMPVWSRDDEGHLSWVNQAYLEAVEAKNASDVLQAQTELLDQRGREMVLDAHETSKRDAQGHDVALARLPVIVAGKRRIFDVVDISAQNGTVGIATDVSSVESTQKALKRMESFHADTMDQLRTPVAIFDSNQQLQYYNAAYCEQFKLEPSFLDTKPSDSAVLDRMRTNRSLPEQADFQGWKSDFLTSYQDVDMREHWWHLPDGQSLRVVATPNPNGGVTYIFENVTERIELEKKYNALFRMQSETLDHLNDGVVVFGSDGRLRVSNPAFTRLWDFPQDLLTDLPHVGAVLEWCRRKHSEDEIWTSLKNAVVGLHDKREAVEGRVERADGRFIDYAAIPLPDGATMITFVDVTDNVAVERGLMDRNEALLAADQLKNTFIQHVSYELRSPLTNIIGFTELLTSEAFGVLNGRQREYTDHIMTSSSSLLTIVNDILDLATIDAGIMVLELGQVDPVDSIRAAAEGLQDRLSEKSISLDISVAENMGEFVGDQKRVRQVLFNLISNAIAFSPESSEISVVADRDEQGILFTVKDQGCGISNDYLPVAFDRFESRKAGSNRRGAGLGLSIVKSFVELHGGTVHIDSAEGQGTEVICRFPIEAKSNDHSAGVAAE